MASLTTFLTNAYALAWLIVVPSLAAIILMSVPRAWGLTIRLVSAVAAGMTVVISALLAWDYWTLVKTGLVAVSGSTALSAAWAGANA